MSDDESRSSGFSEENGEDDEETMAEEELLDEGDDADDELRMLNEENEMSVEELRRRYYGEAAAESEIHPGPSSSSAGPSSSKTLDIAKPSSSANKYFGDINLNDEEEDEDYVPLNSDYWKKEIRIGDDFQVPLPLPEAKEISVVDYKQPVDSQPLWKPDAVSPDVLKDFLKQIRTKQHDLEGTKLTPQSTRTPKCNGVFDDEDALYALYKANYDVNQVLNNLPLEKANGPRIRGPEKWQKMSTDEVEEFEKAFRVYGKNFVKIHQKMPTRSVGELIQFYYSWKKTERYDMFMAANRELGLAEGVDKSVDPMELIADHALNDSTSNGSTIAVTVKEHAPQKTWLSVQPEHQHHSEKP